MKTVDYNGEFISRMIPKLDWAVLRAAAESVSNAEITSVSTENGISSCLLHTQLGYGSGLPPSPPVEYETNEEFLKAAHHVMMEVIKLASVSIRVQ